MSVRFRKLSRALFLSLPLAVSLQASGHAQSPALPAAGESCARPDKKTGIVVEDACGRKACVLKFGSQVPKAEAGLTKKVGCAWTLIDNRCECVVTPAGKKSK